MMRCVIRMIVEQVDMFDVEVMALRVQLWGKLSAWSVLGKKHEDLLFPLVRRGLLR